MRLETTFAFREPGRFALFLGGLSLTSVSLSSGFIWAYQYRPVYVFLAALGAWSGYVVAHYAVTGRPIDTDTRTSEQVIETDALRLPDLWRYPVCLFGIGLLITGMYLGVVFIRAENHLATNLGGAFFLGGYVIAHYAATDEFL